MRNFTTLLSLAFLACALQFAHCSTEESSSDSDYTNTETSVNKSSMVDDSESTKVEDSDSEYSKIENSTVMDENSTVMEEVTESNAYMIVTVEDMKFFVPAEAMEARRKRRNTISPQSSEVWPNNIVPYSFQQNVFNDEEIRIILLSLQHWEKYTCLRFRPRVSSDLYSIQFVNGGDGVCRSFIGRVTDVMRQPQPVTLGPRCRFFPTVVHEIGHAVGFFHEHSRPDSDEHVTFLRENIDDDSLLGNFATVSPNSFNAFSFGYDYASIMHYSPTTFAQRDTVTLVANQEDVHFGDAAELSPLDIAKANALYNCGPQDTHPPRQVVVPPPLPLALPRASQNCDSSGVIQVSGSGSVRSSGFPSHRFNQECIYVLEAPEGFGFQFSFPDFRLENSSSCSKDYVEVHGGASTSSLINFGTSTGRFCDTDARNFLYTFFANVMTFLYHTDSFGSGNAFQLTYELTDIDECDSITGSRQRCHFCTNTVGSFTCGCRDGYYLSEPASTCFDVNECAVDNGGCDHDCINRGGSYECTCRSGFFLQTDGKSCRTTRPASDPTPLPPGTSLPRVQTSSTQAPPTTLPPPTNSPPPGTLPEVCGGGPSVLTSGSGFIQSVGWPNTAYPETAECAWNIECPTGSRVEIDFEDSFRIAGRMPDCTRDSVVISEDCTSSSYGPFCHLTSPGGIESTCNSVTVTFDANGHRGSTRTGFRMNYRCTASPAQPPPETVSPQCGGTPMVRIDRQGFIETVGFSQQAYPLNTNCDWRIECPSDQRVHLTFDPSFKIAGRMPDCPRDQVFIQDCDGDNFYGPFCHLTAPVPRTSICSAVNVSFRSRARRGVNRTGFRLNYECV